MYACVPCVHFSVSAVTYINAEQYSAHNLLYGLDKAVCGTGGRVGKVGQRNARRGVISSTPPIIELSRYRYITLEVIYYSIEALKCAKRSNAVNRTRYHSSTCSPRYRSPPRPSPRRVLPQSARLRTRACVALSHRTAARRVSWLGVRLGLGSGLWSWVRVRLGVGVRVRTSARRSRPGP